MNTTKELPIFALADIGTYSEGQHLSSVADVAGYLRAGATAGEIEIGDVTDDEIVAIASAVPMQAEQADWEEAVLDRLQSGEGVEETGEPLEGDLSDVATKVDGDKEIERFLMEAVDGQEKVDGNPAFILSRLHILLPTPADRALIPVPGSKVEDGSNGPFDVYSTRKQNNDGDWRDVKGSRVRDFINSHHIVAAKQAKIDEIKRKVPEGSKPSNADTAQIKQYMAQRSTASRQLLRSIKAMHVWDTLLSHEHVGALFETLTVSEGGKDVEKMLRTKYPFVLFDRHKPTNGAKLSASAFGNLKPDNTMRLSDVQRSGKRAPRKPETGHNFEAKDLSSAFAGMVTALENNGIFTPLVTAMQKEAGNHLFLTAARLRDILIDAVDKADTAPVQEVKKDGKVITAAKPSRLKALRDAERAAGNAPEQNAA